MTQETAGAGHEQADEARLDAVRERIDEAKDAEEALHEQDALGDVGEVWGSGRGEQLGVRQDADEHGAFEPSGAGPDTGTDPGEGPDADTPGEA